MSAWTDARIAAPLALGLLAMPSLAQAHGTDVAARPVAAISVDARFDTGEPMAGAQVLVFAPDAPAEAWGRGTTDAEGRYLFMPDPALQGRWTIQVRQAGHGAITHLDVAGTGAILAQAAQPATGGQTALQRALMVALVAWGALGTALFVRSRQSRGGAGDASA